jgi:hypothetical protein
MCSNDADDKQGASEEGAKDDRPIRPVLIVAEAAHPAAVSNEARLQTIFLRLSTGELSKPWCLVRASDLPCEFDDHVEQVPADWSGSTGARCQHHACVVALVDK